MFLKNKINVSPVLVLLVTIVLFSNVVISQTACWTTKTPMPTPRFWGAACELDGIIYVIGGATKESYTNSVTTVEAYDTATDTWTTKADMSVPRMGFVACSVNGKVYAVAGDLNPWNFEGNSGYVVEEYDPRTDTWQTKKQRPISQGYLAGAAIGDKIYTFGGGGLSGSGATSSVYSYDTVTDTWTKNQQLPTARAHLRACAVNGLAYVIGGAVTSAIIQLPVNEVYDPFTDTWIIKKDMPSERLGLAVTAIGDKIYAIGGGYPNGSRTVEIYDTVNDSWATGTAMPTSRTLHTACAVNGKIYVIGGEKNHEAGGIMGIVEVYDPSLDLRPFLKTLNVDKCYVLPGSDTVCFSAKMNDPSGMTLIAEVQSSDQTPVGSVQLYDDGAHNDGQAGDSLYANTWSVLSAEEQQYYVDILATKIETDTLFQQIDNMTSFTSIGPLVVDTLIYRSTTPTAYPGKKIQFHLYLENLGKNATAANLTGFLSCCDSMVKVNISSKSFDDAAPGEIVESKGFYAITIPETAAPGSEIQLQIAIDGNGFLLWSDTFSITVEDPTHAVNIEEIAPEEFALHQNYPNPFNPTTTIEYTLPQPGQVTLSIYNLFGQHVQTFVNEKQNAGTYSHIWNATDETGNKVSSGIYVYRLEFTNVTGREAWRQERKMLLLK